MNTFVHIELRAKNDANGNPRRLSLLICNNNGEQNVVAVQDHGYRGSPRGWGHPACSIDIPPAEYKYWTGGNIRKLGAGFSIPNPYGKEVSA